MSAANPLSLLSPATSVLNTATIGKTQPVQERTESQDTVSFAEEFDNATAILTQNGQTPIAPENEDFSEQLSLTVETQVILNQELSDEAVETTLTIDPELIVNADVPISTNPLSDLSLSLLAPQTQAPVNSLTTHTPITSLDTSSLHTISFAIETAASLSSASPSVFGQVQKATELSLSELVPELVAETSEDGNKANEPSTFASSSDETPGPMTSLLLTKNKTQQEGGALFVKDFIGLPEANIQDNQSSQKINGAATFATEMNTRLADSSASIARNFVVQTQIPVAVTHPQWTQAVGEKVLWLAAQNVSSAEIKLDPPELGSLQVKVSLHQEQASITFVSPHASVREALDQQMQRLRDMFQEQGIALLHVDVSDKSFSRQRQDADSENKQRASAFEEEVNPVGVTELSSRSIHLIDHYA